MIYRALTGWMMYIWRVRIVPLRRTFNQLWINRVEQKLIKESDGIINWCFRLSEIHGEGLEPTMLMKGLLSEYRTNEDPVNQFVETCYSNVSTTHSRQCMKSSRRSGIFVPAKVSICPQRELLKTFAWAFGPINTAALWTEQNAIEVTRVTPSNTQKRITIHGNTVTLSQVFYKLFSGNIL